MLKTSGIWEHAKCLRSECVKWQKKINDFTKCSFGLSNNIKNQCLFNAW